ncbi:hypothetical protein Ocin01_07848 [Orchesella cincta]|uniref:DUF4789 domain-containing protein n=1 Tax=Orchesella cincta TaxID=48709 RepID=A0A1D2N0W1_ORCCI|nr:hypothetical protein Ocin01_07848 [Orchesella cincta]
MANMGKLVFSCNFCLLLLFMLLCEEITKKSNLMAHARFVPVSKSFRFPSSFEESDLLAQDSKQSNGNTHLTKVLLASQPRRTSSSLNAGSIPESASPDEVISKDLISSSYSTEEDTFSSEVIHADSTSGEGEPAANSPKKAYEDEDLRIALCSNNSSNLGGSPPPITLKLRYDLQAGKCGEVGTTAHCGRNMIFVAEIDSAAYGYCECDFENKIRNREEKQIGRATPFVFHLETNACYALYEQGYCKDGEWLVLSQKEKKSVCEKKRCPSSEKVMKSAGSARNSRRRSKLLTPELWVESSTTSSSQRKARSTPTIDNAVWVPLNGTGPCVQLNKESTEYCDNGEQVLFTVGNTVPKCGVPGREIEGRAIIRNACPPGSFYSIIGRCQPDWDF